MSAPPTSRRAGGGGRKQRRVRHYLLDPRFQLKYTGLLVGAVLAVMTALGVVIWQLGNAAAEGARFAATQAEMALKESHTSSRIVRMNALAAAADSPDLVKALEAELAQTDRQAEENLAKVKAHRDAVERDRERLLNALAFTGLSLLVLLTAIGIFITHRIVGPVFKMKRLLRQVGSGRLVVRERLRRGDELGDLFETFLQMTLSLKSLQADRVATLDSIIKGLEASGQAPETLARLRELRAQLQLTLGDEAGG
ncbi:MAG TPA: HAMP domain-containing protein [Polyangiaceae bacterium]|nr:HAMP domain-containing protein [Polyangiaceae bacterium]